MTTTCLIIIAWAASLPLWVSITITVLAGIRLILKVLRLLLKALDECSRN